MKVSLRSFLKRNWLTIIAILAGIAVSNHFYKKSIAKREPVFLLDPLRTEIVDSKHFAETPLRVVRASGDEIKGDVTSIRFYFWNNGRQSIKPLNILEPLVITLDDPNGEILDYKILRCSRQVVKPVLKRNAADPNRSLSFSCAILEQEDGLSGQLIYEGNPDAGLTVAGIVEGVNAIQTNAEAIRGQFWKQLRKELYVAIPIVGFFGILVLVIHYLEKKQEKGSTVAIEALALTKIGVVVGLVLIAYFTIQFSRLEAKAKAPYKVTQTVPKDIIP